jgi:D-arginine dehydrogenase
MNNDIVFDYAVIGAGMAGASIAYELSRQGKLVLILEMEDQPGYHSTGRSAALLFESYGNEVVRSLTKFSKSFFQSPPKGFSDYPLLSPRAALFIAKENQLENLDKLYHSIKSLSAQIVKADSHFALSKVEKLKLTQVKGCVWDPNGWDIDVASVHQGYLKLAKANYAQLVLNANVNSIEKLTKHWRISTEKSKYRAHVVINAAGAWADKIAQQSGLKPVGLQPKKRTICMVPIATELNVESWPMVIDVDEQFYFKPDGGNLLLSPADETDVEPMDAYTDIMDVAVAVDRVTQVLDIEVTRVTHEWAGLRSFVEDKSPVIGFDSADETFFWLAGQGGYGIQMAPGIAMLAAAMMLDKPMPEELEAMGFTVNSVSPQRYQS